MGRPTCYRCFRPQVACICSLVREVDNRTRVLIVQHPRERRHPFGTVRIARLGLRNVEVVVGHRHTDGFVRPPAGDLQRAAVLYPGPTATMLGEGENPQLDTLVVLDGTWPTSRKLLRVCDWVAALPRVAFTPPRAGNYRIRLAKNPKIQVSTVEAIAYALQHLEPDNAGIEGLIHDFDAVIDHQISLQGENKHPRIRKSSLAKHAAKAASESRPGTHDPGAADVL
ncbi:MAG: tRNA-uridine aminocarboxypropyltransferase [Myxococcota bacterium]